MKVPLFIYDDMPKPMKRYLGHFGWSFNKAACEYAISKMWREDAQGNKKKIEVKSKEQVYDILRKHGIELKHDELYNATYAWHMVAADMLGISVDDERHHALSVKAIIDDPDKPGGNVFSHWYWDMIDFGHGVEFDDFMDD